MGRWLVRALLALALAMAATASQPQAEERNAEQQVKAAFLYKFVGYVDWPADTLGAAGTPFTIGVLGAEPLAAELIQVVAGRKVQERPIVVRRIRYGEPVSDLAMLFIGNSEMERAKPLVGTLHTRPMLVVTETEGALPLGSMINFLLVDRRVRFEISLDSAEKGGLRLSSRLLAVAHKVRSGGS